ncbi:hepatitis A virus cellular receptor 1-like isoform X2 [Polyodon spathula]|uniref:hepatitis A virus cellular receptor 1-like isoform X2 n=1 Tax=Polyodon spathula TaxID=7913 RepID=UPI001B7F7561|nr:hepatitis A virus cellular receptor 1-like isoform X2 [Polyodon spathula]
MALSTQQSLALLLILNSAHLTIAYCSAPDHVAVSGSAGGRAVLPCSYTPTSGQHVEVRWYAYPDQGEPVLLIDNSETPSAPIPAQLSGRVKLSDEGSSGNASLLISELRLEDSQNYICTVGINGICITYRNVKLTVQETPKKDSTTSRTATANKKTRPSATPTTRPSVTLTTTPSATPTTRPSATPTTRPSANPTTTPSATPTTRPSANPTTTPSATPRAAVILSAVAVSVVICIGVAVFVILQYKRRAELRLGDLRCN